MSVSNTAAVTIKQELYKVPITVYFGSQLQTLDVYSSMKKVTILTKISRTFDNSFAERLFIPLYKVSLPTFNKSNVDNTFIEVHSLVCHYGRISHLKLQFYYI